MTPSWMQIVAGSDYILDTETTGLNRSSGMLEAALFNLQSGNVDEYILHPNFVRVKSASLQDAANMTSSMEDVYENVIVKDWDEARARTNLESRKIDTSKMTRDEALLAGKEHADVGEWLERRKAEFPQLSGNHSQTHSPERMARFTREGVNFQSTNVSVGEFIGKLDEKTKGKMVWIYNAPFESKIIGSHAAALDMADGLKKNLEHRNPYSPDPFYVTGREINQSRALAQMTGDWTGVFSAYRNNVLKRDGTGVGDILDIVRAMGSYGEKLGIKKKGRSFLGTSADVVSQIFALAEGDNDFLNMREFHRAAEDASIHEKYILQRAGEYSEILEHVHNKTPIGLQQIELAKRGEGALYRAMKVFSLQDELIDTRLKRASLVQRLGRAYEDIQAQGITKQTTGGHKIRVADHLTKDDRTVKIVMADSTFKNFKSMDEVLNHLNAAEKLGDYGLDAHQEYKLMIDNIQGRPDVPRLRAASEYVNSVREELVGNIDFSKLKGKVSGLVDNLPTIKFPAAKMLGGSILGMAAVGLLLSPFQGEKKKTESVLTYDYERWKGRIDARVDGNDDRVNRGLAPGEHIEGMGPGIAQAQRRLLTDFGSPYRGPVGSEQVFEQQRQIEERSRWIRQQYGISHYDPNFGVMNIFKGGRRYLSGGQSVDGGYRGLQGQNLMSVNLDDGWKVTAEDADTLVLRRKGLINSMSSFFGMGEEYSVRLAGLDATELSHRGNAAQPFAEEAKRILQQKLDGGGSMEVVTDTSDMSYGRSMGALFIDGRNINYELVEQGVASHLPYGDKKYAMIDYDVLKEKETAAVEGNRGLWGTMWGQAFHDISTATGQRPTFNTLASGGIKNTSYMQMVNAMDNAQALGKLPMDWEQVKTGIVQHYSMFDDKVGSGYFNAPVTSYKNSLFTMMLEVSKMTKNSGSLRNKSPEEAIRPKLEKKLALDSLGTSTAHHSRRRNGFEGAYGVDKMKDRVRKQNMASNQQTTLSGMFMSGQGHYRM